MKLVRITQLIKKGFFRRGGNNPPYTKNERMIRADTILSIEDYPEWVGTSLIETADEWINVKGTVGEVYRGILDAKSISTK